MPKKQTDEPEEYGLKATDLMYLIQLPTEEWGKYTEAEKKKLKEYKEYMRACLIQKIYAENWGAQQKWESAHRGRYLEGPLYRRIARISLEELYNNFKAGDKQALLEAMRLCMEHAVPLPHWCTTAFLSSFGEVYTYKAKSWDDVFGRPHRKGIHLYNKRMELEKSILVYYRIKEVNEGNLFGHRERVMVEGAPVRNLDGKIKWCNPSAIGEELFKRVGKEFNVGKTLAEKYYYAWKNRIEMT